jgi:hydrogenase maturation factor
LGAERQRRRGFVVSIVGLILVILGVLWVAIIFPALDKMPTDYARTYYFDGNFMVVDPATQLMESFPIEQILEQKANGTQDGALLIHEKRTILRTDTNPATDISSIYGDESTLAVDRHTLKFVPDIDMMHRTGYWEPPRGLGKDNSSFDLWNPGANEPLTAEYMQTEDFRGMKVVLFRIDAGNITLPGAESSVTLYYKTTIDLLIDPRTGTVVDQDSVSITSLDPMGSMPVQISNVRYAETTIVDQMDVAKDAQRMLLWFETVIPWVLIGLGAIMVIIDAAFISRTKAAQ